MPTSHNEQKCSEKIEMVVEPVNPFYDFCGKHKLDFSKLNEQEVGAFVDNLNKAGLSASGGSTISSHRMR